MFDVMILAINPELKQEYFDAFLPLVSSEKQKRIKKFHFFRDARNCLLGDILVRAEICRITGLHNNQLEFSTSKFGKPLFLTYTNIHFNISHAGNYVACVLSDEPVGIDIETIKPVDFKIPQRFFSPDEASYVENGELTHFYEIWTKKESYIKWRGEGLHIPLTSFNVLNSSGGRNPLYHKVFENIYSICHVCSIKNTPPMVFIINTDEFVQRAMKL